MLMTALFAIVGLQALPVSLSTTSPIQASINGAKVNGAIADSARSDVQSTAPAKDLLDQVHSNKTNQRCRPGTGRRQLL